MYTGIFYYLTRRSFRLQLQSPSDMVTSDGGEVTKPSELVGGGGLRGTRWGSWASHSRHEWINIIGLAPLILWSPSTSTSWIQSTTWILILHDLLTIEERCFQRRIKEAIYIRALRPSLNRDDGRYDLPTIWHNRTRSRIKSLCE